MGFFVLSSFLLTYRLLVDFNRASDYKALLLITLKYAIRRFLRIYVAFFLFATLLQVTPKEVGGCITSDNCQDQASFPRFSSWHSLVTLESAGNSLFVEISNKKK